ncbi:hypothetical protein GQ568_01660 [Patescibacteria group bacterium]|nr:hypothetical protein [Patescibacteria group bacterium]
MADSNNTKQEITFIEFEESTAEEGHPLYKDIKTNDLSNFKELLFHTLMAHIATVEDTNINNVRLPKEQWHKYYVEALTLYLFPGRSKKV